MEHPGTLSVISTIEVKAEDVLVCHDHGTCQKYTKFTTPFIIKT